MQGRLENQIKTEKKIKKLLAEMPYEISEYYINFSVNKEFRSCLSYIQKLKRFLNWYCEENDIEIKNIDFKLITDKDIALYLIKSEKKEKDGATEYTSFSYRKQIWSVLNSFFDFLDEKKYINSNPVHSVKRLKKNDDVKHTFLKKNDLDKMIDVLKNEINELNESEKEVKWKVRDLTILYMFIFTGMRESALCEIDINKIDFENNIIEVIDKGRKTNTYTMTETLVNMINEWLVYRKDILRETNSDALFVSNQRKRINQETVRLIIRRYSKKALGKEVSPHRLRAAYGNILYNTTHDIKFTSASMKHSNISTTQIYIEDDEQIVNNKVADILGNLF